MEVCKKCGAEVEGIYCPQCGEKLEVVGEEYTLRDQHGSSLSEKPEASVQILPNNSSATPFVKNEMRNSALIMEVEKKGKGFAIASLVLGIFSILSFGILFVPEVLGVIFAFVSKNGKPMLGLAKGGLICSIVGFVILVLLIVL